MSVKVCKFLVDSGCDVDLAAVAFHADVLRDTPLHCSHFLESDLNEDELEQLLLCRKHLLQAGADPTIASVDMSGSEYSRSAVEKALGQATGGCRTTVSSCRSGSRKELIFFRSLSSRSFTKAPHSSTCAVSR